MNNLKSINISHLIKQRLEELDMDMDRICNFFKYEREKVEEILQQESMDTEILLKWSKLLEYDFFRIYTQHLILYAPQSKISSGKLTKNRKTLLPTFRKNIYTKEIIDFILEEVDKKEKTKQQIIDEYRIPKTTLFKWIAKHKENF
ncbi:MULTISPECIES: hypothetical protein [Chryseobacterium]|uniref:Uncharacterized protein n=1 Tax=Chryseobacterium oleae TaxID=491207 RepID=A0A1I4XD45_CHROL|nr:MULTISPECIES: hypothetical protein [Chryseobacterium]SFN23582.1 hypothetical protein SAMN05421594_1722 [Chryseobacterium oleae]SHF41049.1 hypothetical protein SAMN02787100_1915 [Chryseobacterium sp. OV279]